MGSKLTTPKRCPLTGFWHGTHTFSTATRWSIVMGQLQIFLGDAFLVWKLWRLQGDETRQARCILPSLTSSVTCNSNCQQKVSLRIGIQWVYFTSECKMKMVTFNKLQVNTTMSQFSSHLKENLCPYTTGFGVIIERWWPWKNVYLTEHTHWNTLNCSATFHN
jgi:hypothetical protein